jgi:SSS family solute:Na+ symporter
VFGLFTRRLGAPALLAGWAVGMAGGSWIAFADGIKPVHTFMVDGNPYTVYTGLLALAANVAVAVVVQLLLGQRGAQPAAPALRGSAS